MDFTDIKNKACQGGKYILFETAKTGLGSIIFGRLICQLTGADPSLFRATHIAANVVKVSDALLCKTMLAYGPANATKKAISLDLSIVLGGLAYHELLGYFELGEARDAVYSNLLENGALDQAALIVALCTVGMFAADWIDHAPFKWGRSACVEAMNLRAKEIPDLPSKS